MTLLKVVGDLLGDIKVSNPLRLKEPYPEAPRPAACVRGEVENLPESGVAT